ncbi:hypothetical protein [Salmonella phage NINP13076]|uniref:Uncharacterized protein n=1 Tax=Salmonella phage SalP219 TaxID=3158864 RepID=A0AAU7PIK6_9CAUD|nr:hypothetical protein [Salmonella phage NINP13076]
MNKFCVGQKVVDSFNDRKLRTVIKTFESGQIELDNGVITYADRVQCQDHYLDKTNFLYHHSRFGDGQSMAKEAFSDYLFWRDTLEDAKAIPNMSEKFINACSKRLEDASAIIEKGLAWKRTAEHNLSQWDGLTLDHHFPFINFENLTDY